MAEALQKIRKILCPICGNTCEFSPQNQFRPFCSKRCQMIDLGQWASEGYTIPENTQPNDNDTFPDDLQEN